MCSSDLVFNQPEGDPALVADQPQPDAGHAPFADWSEDDGDGQGDAGDAGDDDAHHIHDDDEAGFHEGDDAGPGAASGEAPSGTRRISRMDQRRIRPHKARTVRRRQPHSRRRGRWRGRIAALIALILAGALIWFLVELFQPLGTSPHGNVTVVIPPKSSTKEIGALLQRQGVIARGVFFELRATLGGERGDLRSGTYHLQLGMSYASVLDALSKAPKAAPTTQLRRSSRR